MIFDGSVRELGFFDVDKILKELPDCSDSLWTKTIKRQQKWAVHSDTLNIPIIRVENYSDRPITETIIHNEYPESLVKVVTDAAEEVQKHINGLITFAILVSLPAGKKIGLHKDAHPLNLIRRCHLPITTNDECIFTLVNTEFKFAPGVIYEINNQLPHKVENNGSTARVHLIVDILPNENI